MPPAKGPLCKFFHVREKQNSSQYKAHCFGCVNQHWLNDVAINVDDENILELQAEVWFTTGVSISC